MSLDIVSDIPAVAKRKAAAKPTKRALVKIPIVARKSSPAVTVTDAIEQWLRVTGSPLNVTDVDDVVTRLEEIVDGDGIDGFSCQRMILQAMYYPPVYGDSSDCERLLFVAGDLEMDFLVSKLSKPLARAYAYADAMTISSVIEEVSSIIGGLPHPAHMQVDIYDMVCQLCFVDLVDIECVASRGSKNVFDIYEALCVPTPVYPLTSPERTFRFLQSQVRRTDTSTQQTAQTPGGVRMPATLDLDSVAHEAFLQGADLARVIKFHNNVPAGYWEYVASIIEDLDGDVEAAYQRAEQEFNFHPVQRPDF